LADGDAGEAVGVSAFSHAVNGCENDQTYNPSIGACDNRQNKKTSYAIVFESQAAVIGCFEHHPPARDSSSKMPRN
jgi:hypothetical protein